MQVNNFVYNYPYRTSASPEFKARGQAISLEYIYKNRCYLLPERVKKGVSEILSQGIDTPSLLEVHKALYKPLLDCQSLEDAKNLYPEFKDILSDVTLQMNSIYAKQHGVVVDSKLVLKLLQEYWANLCLKDEMAHNLGMKSRNTLNWLLEKIAFVSFDKNYRGLLKASDPEGNKIIADKTVAWNLAHPEERQQLNKNAAQSCKTAEYREAQRARMYKYDMEHPERREKIALFSQKMWEYCPEIKKAFSEYTKSQQLSIRRIIDKKKAGKTLSECERRIYYTYWKRFWETYPELKQKLSEAAQKAKEAK